MRSSTVYVCMHPKQRQLHLSCFARYLSITPEDLVESGLYSNISTLLTSGAHREVSLGQLAKKLGATAIRSDAVGDGCEMNAAI